MEGRNLLIPASVIAVIEQSWKARNAAEFQYTGEKPVTDDFILDKIHSVFKAEVEQRTEAFRKKQLVRIGELQARGYTFEKACEAVGMVVPKNAAVQPVGIRK